MLLLGTLSESFVWFLVRVIPKLGINEVVEIISQYIQKSFSNINRNYLPISRERGRILYRKSKTRRKRRQYNESEE